MFFAAGERSSDVVATLKARRLVIEWHSSCARDTSRKAADGTPGGGNQQHFAQTGFGKGHDEVVISPLLGGASDGGQLPHVSPGAQQPQVLEGRDHQGSPGVR